MSSKKQRNRDKVQRTGKKYIVRYKKSARVFYTIMDVLCLFFGVVMLYSVTTLSSQLKGYTSNLIITVVLGIVMLLIGVLYYPPRIRNFISVEGNQIVIHRMFHAADTITYRDVKHIVSTDGKQPAYNRSPKHYVIMYGNGQSCTIQRDSMENGEDFFKDLKSHGIVVKL